MSKPAPARLRLRAMQDTDLAFFSSLYADAETMRHIGRVMAPEEAVASFRATLRAMRRPRGPRFFVIAGRRDGRPIGLCSIQPLARSPRCAELGIMLAQAWRGRQLAHEAMLQLMAAAFETLSIDTLWVQYRSANVAAVRLFAGLGFVARSGARPRTARPTQCVRYVQRSLWQSIANQPPRGVPMSNLPVSNTIGSNMIGFLESVGRDAALRHASREQLLQAMQDGQLPAAQRTAVRSNSRAAIDEVLGTNETLYCSNFPAKPPKKAPPKKPGKAPPKKKPSKIEMLASAKSSRH